MLTFIVRRVAYSIPVLLIASMLVFVFVHETSDPLAHLRLSRDLTVVANEGLREGIYQEPCKNFIAGDPPRPAKTCAKAPIAKQYWSWLSHFVQGKMGNSYITNRAVSSQLKSAFGSTLQLIVWGVLISAIIAILIGVYSAVRQYSAMDYIFTGLAFIGISMPPFWFGLIAIELFSFQAKTWFHLKNPPLFSVGLHGHHAPGLLAGAFDYSRHLALPVLTLTVQIVAEWSRYQRSSMLDVMSSDYIRTAKAKGLSETKVIFKHGLRNALIPLVTVMALEIGLLFGGLLVTEQIFSIPGMGTLFLTSLQNGDTQVLLPWFMITAVFVIAFNLLADILYGVLDPRIRLS